MEKSKRKNEDASLHRYWRMFIPLTAMLMLMINFPLRIDLRESTLDALFYGSISLMCIATAIQVYRRFGKRGMRLIGVTILCVVLSGWQVVDMTILRYEGLPATTFPAPSSDFEPFDYHWAWYNLRFPNDEIVCHTLFERYIGNNIIAIAYDINRNASWFSCGG